MILKLGHIGKSLSTTGGKKRKATTIDQLEKKTTTENCIDKENLEILSDNHKLLNCVADQWKTLYLCTA